MSFISVSAGNRWKSAGFALLVWLVFVRGGYTAFKGYIKGLKKLHRGEEIKEYETGHLKNQSMRSTNQPADGLYHSHSPEHGTMNHVVRARV